MKRKVFILALFLFSAFQLMADNDTWRKNYSFSLMDFPGRMIQTSDGNYVFCGFNTAGIKITGNVTKVDTLGNLIWSKKIGGLSIATGLYDIIEISPANGGGYLVAGESSPGAIMVRLFDDGTLNWSKRYEYPDHPSQSSSAWFNKVIETSDGKFLGCGGVNHFMDSDSVLHDSVMPFIMAVDANSGALEWDNAFVFDVLNDDEHVFNDLTETADGYIFTGYTSEGEGTLNDNGDYPRDGLIVKTDLNGVFNYARIYGDAGESESVESVITLSGGDALMGGYSGDYGTLMTIDGTGSSPSIGFGHKYIATMYMFLEEPLMFSEVMEMSDGNYAAIGSYFNIWAMPYKLYATATKINSSSGALTVRNTFLPDMDWDELGLENPYGLLPKGGITEDMAFFMFMQGMGTEGFNYHLIKTDETGSMNNPECPEGTYDANESSYSPTLNVSTPPYDYRLVETENFITPINEDIVPDVVTICEYIVCDPPPAPDVVASPEEVCEGDPVTITASGSGSNVTYYYYTQATGGTPIDSGPQITVNPVETTTYYVDALHGIIPDCYSDRTPVTITVIPTPDLDPVDDVVSCGSYELPPMANGDYFAESGGVSPIPDGTIVSGDTTLYVWAESGTTPNCTVEESFTITIEVSPEIDPLADQTQCSGFQLPDITGTNLTGAEAYYTGTDGTGDMYNAGDVLNYEDFGSYPITLYMFDDNGGCSDEESFELTMYPAPTIAAGSNSPACFDQSIELTESGGDATSWNWSGPNGFTSTEQNPVISPAGFMHSGTYYVTATDDNGCTNTDNVEVIVVKPPSATASSNSPVCEGADIELHETAGEADTWAWSGPNGFSSTDQNPVISPATPDADSIYTVTVTDANGCTATDNVDVEVNPVSDAYAQSNSPVCEGENIELSETGGGAETWLWSGPSGFTSTSPSPVIASATISNSGTYSVTITDASGCTNTDDVDVTVNTTPSEPEANIDCSGGADNGLITVTVPLGAEYEYTVDGITFQPEVEFGPLANGSYAVTVMNIYSGCTASGPSFNLDCGCTDPTTLNLSLLSGSTCETEAFTVSNNTFGGSATEVNLSHDGNGSLNATNFTSSPFGFIYTPDPADAGNTVTITVITDNPEGNPCVSAEQDFVLTVNEAGIVIANSDSPVCEGDDIHLTETGGYAVSWNWDGPDGFTSTDNNPVISAATTASSGTYSVTITDGSGCTNVDDVNVMVSAIPEILAESNSPVCENENIELTESAGDGNAWNWDGPDGFTSGQNNPVITAVTIAASGTYTVSVTNTYGCSNTGNVDVTVDPAPDVPEVDIDCPGGENTGTITVTSPLGAEYQYSIDGNYQTEITFGPLDNGAYTVTVMNTTTGCTVAGDMINLDCGCTDPTTLTLSSSAGNTCETNPYTVNGNTYGGSATEVDLTHDGNGTLDATNFTTSPFDFTYTPDAGDIGNTVTITITTNNPLGFPCASAEETFMLTVNPAPAINAGSNSPVCEGNNITLTESGGAAVNWSWSGPDSFSSSQHNPIIGSASNDAAGTYEVTVTDINGCTNTDAVDVSVNSAPAVLVNNNSPICEGEDITLSETAGEAESWAWSGPAGFSSSSPTPTIVSATTANSGLYTVTVTDDIGCTSSGIADVTVNPTPATPMTSIDCSGGEDNGTIEVTSPLGDYEYSIDGISFQPEVEFGPLTNGSYIVTVNDITSGCTASGTSILLDCGCANSTSLTLSETSGTTCETDPFTLGGNTFGGSATEVSLSHDGDGSFDSNSFTSSPFTFTYNPGPADAGNTVIITVTTNNPEGSPCVSSEELFVLNVKAAPDVNAVSNSPVCVGDQIDLSEIGGDAISWEWDGPDGFSSIMNNPGINFATTASSGTYSVTVTDGNGCTNMDNVDVQVYEIPDPTIDDPGEFCANNIPIDLTATPTGGIWDGNGITDTINGTFDPSVAGAGDHVITYIAGTSPCTDYDEITITVHPVPDATIDDPGVFCYTDTAVDLTAATSGGTWNGTGITDTVEGTFDPATADIGINTITYVVSDGTCTGSDTINIIVHESADATIDSIPDYYCADNFNDTLTAATSGGYWLGEGIDSTGVFNPYIAGSGTHQIIYTIPDPCGDADTVEITVYSRADATIIDPVDTLMVTDDPVELQTSQAGGEWYGTGVDNTGTFTPQDAGVGDHEIMYAINQICGDADTIIIVVIPDLDLLIPDVITPNSDDLNDTWKIQGISAFEQVDIWIFTRWGDKIFEFSGSGNSYADPENQWDGTRNGKELPFGTYVYILELNNENNYKGTVTLIR
ncbi:MAG: gliding motility-associated C-terminal domain-containing protein [Bacteroidota bacterium]|nr:gliding motility-associated C-terminal domain-containing protein [Bacteroidota bacterium]